MRRALGVGGAVVVLLCLVSSALPPISGATSPVIRVASGGDLQAALDAATPGTTILLAPGATYRGNFLLRAKSGTGFITVQTDVTETGAFAPGVRLTASAAASLAKIQSSNTMSALRTAAGAHHWRLQLLRFGPNDRGYGDIIDIGSGGSSQNSFSLVPYTFVLDRLYIYGDPLMGQKRGIGLNARDVTITNSTIRDIKTVGQDTQAICGWNGPGPFLIENNYLEAAGENFLLGGSDPSISGLIPSSITFRRNYLSKPVSWRDPIIAPPTSVTWTIGLGSLGPGTYSYRIVARRPAGQGAIAHSLPSSAATVTLSWAGSVRVTWTAVANATEYYVYRTSGTSTVYWVATQTAFTDSGAAGTSGAVPTSATNWSVKNIFELKNARDLVVENNVFENNWLEAQPGYAIVLTPRNSNGACTWCTIQNLEFRYNIVRHSGSAINILGYDNGHPSGPASDLRIHDNLFYDINGARWGGAGTFLQMGNGPSDVIVDHNTVDHAGTIVVSMYGGTATDPIEIPRFKYTNNLSRHGKYGFFASGMTTGWPSITAYLPDGVITHNVLSGGTASKYPAGNIFSPDVATQWVNAGAGDYRLVSSSPFRLAATDGRDIGADIANLPNGVDDMSSGGCTDTISPRSQSVTANGGTGTVAVTAPSGCAWTAVSNDDWLTVTAGASASGNGSVSFSAAANTSTSSRTGTLTIAGNTFTVTQTAISCDTTITPTSQAVAATGGSGTITVTAPGGCAWSATTPNAWVTITSGATGSGNGTVAYAVAANTGTSGRSATVTIGGLVFTISQPAAGSCGYTVSPLTINVAAAGGSGSINVDTASGCNWLAASAALWISTTSSGSGPGTATYTVDPNTGPDSRTGAIVVGGQWITVTQPGTCSSAISPTSQSFGANGGNATVALTSPAGCAWTAVSNASWITVTSGASGSGSGSIGFTVAANTTSSSRTGTLTIGGSTFTVTEAGSSCSDSISPTSQSVAASGGSGSVSVTAGTGCAWAATSNATWITITSGANGSGNGTVAFTVAANTSSSSRSATLTVAGKSFTISQAAGTCSYTLSPTTVNVSATGGSGSIAVTTGAGCNWLAASAALWISTTSMGSGSGTATYTVAANTSTSSRSGYILIGGVNVTMTQSAATAPTAPANLRVTIR
jgi:Viral BACON domain/Putative binding domain, N-terminal